MLAAIRGNTHISYIGSGEKANSYLYYVTNYTTKAALPTYHQLHYLVAAKEALEFSKQQDPDKYATPRAEAFALINKCINKLHVANELPIQFVMARLLGYPDHFTNLKYDSANWRSFCGYLRRCRNPGPPTEEELQADDADHATVTEPVTNIEDLGYIAIPLESIKNAMTPSDTEKKYATTHESANSYLDKLKTRLSDYIHRPLELENISVYDYYSRFSICKDDTGHNENTDNEETAPTSTKPSRQRNLRFAFPDDYVRSEIVKEHSQSSVRTLIFKGGRPPSDLDTDDLYLFRIGMFVPWRSVDGLFTDSDTSWRDVYNRVWQYVPEDLKQVAHQTYCRVTLKDSVDEQELGTFLADDHTTAVELYSTFEGLEMDDITERLNMSFAEKPLYTYSPSSIQALETMATLRPRISDVSSYVPAQRYRNKGTLSTWKRQMESNFEAYDVEEDEATKGLSIQQQTIITNETPFESADVDPYILNVTPIPISDALKTLVNTHAKGLFRDQKRAYYYIAHHMIQTHLKNPVKQLLFVCQGRAGTGKTMVIKRLQKLCAQLPGPDMLITSASTGVAACQIEGSTIHSVAHLGVKTDGGNQASLGELYHSGELDRVLPKLNRTFRHKRYLIIDEMSVLNQFNFKDLHEGLCIYANPKNPFDKDMPFGGYNIILFGDFGQLPPIGSSCIYQDHQLFSKFTATISLEEIVRQNEDPRFRTILDNVRNGIATRDDYELLQQRILAPGKHTFTDGIYSDLRVIVARKRDRTAINLVCLIQIAHQRNEPIHCILAQQKRNHLPVPSLWQHHYLTIPDKNDSTGLFYYVIGMPVMLTENSNVSIGLVNGAKGTLVDIVYENDDADEEQIIPTSHLLYPLPSSLPDTIRVRNHVRPLYALVQFEHSLLKKPLLGLANQFLLPIAPRSKTISLKDFTFSRIDFPLMAAFAMTDYKSQGQTIPHLVVDLASPPPPGKKRQSNYVCLSRAPSLDRIYVLRPFTLHDIQREPTDADRALEKTQKPIIAETVVEADKLIALFNKNS